VPTHTIFLTFTSPTMPEWVTVLYRQYKVEPYLLNPVWCDICQKLWHPQNRCTSDIMCLNCGTKDHFDTICPQPVQCANCVGAHASGSLDCPVSKKWQFKKSVLKSVSVIPGGLEEVFQSTA
jgi:hypothetical protein